LAVLARTCTLISKPALDALWAFQDTIIPLLDCMPPTIWQNDRLDGPMLTFSIQSLRRPIVPSDWDRPRMYMHRVRVLSCTDASFPPGIDVPGLFEILRLSLPTQYLFPNLRGLRWIFHQIPALSLVPLVLAPGIKVIAIGTFTSIPHLIILAGLSARCPSLTGVQIFQPDSPERDQSQAVSFFVRRLTHIQGLELANLDQASFEHLLRAPHLHTVTLSSSNRRVLRQLSCYPAALSRTSRRCVTSCSNLPHCNQSWRSSVPSPDQVQIHLFPRSHRSRWMSPHLPTRPP
ncbi:hypothetical protein B0H16DRAFT_1327627, partial [Mycena metata]